MAEFTCDACGHANDLFAENTAELRTERLLELPFDPALQQRVTPDAWLLTTACP